MTDLSPEGKALVDLARDGDSPTPDDRVRVRRALAAGIAAGLTGSAASAAAASKSALGAAAGAGAVAKTTIGLWLVAGAVVGLAGSTALFVAGTGQRPPEAAPAPTLPAPAALAAPSPAAAAPAPTHDLLGEEAPAPRTAEARGSEGADEAPARVAPPREMTRVTGQATAARPLAPAQAEAAPPRAASRDDSAEHGLVGPRTSTLGAETALLENARTALGQGDAASALTLLERHEREFPGGALVEERLAAKVFALCGLGRRAEAVRTAARLLQASPNSPLRARVLDSCAYRP